MSSYMSRDKEWRFARIVAEANGFGLDVDVEIDRDAGTYKGTGIGGAKLALKMGDEDSPQAKMLGEMFGDGYNLVELQMFNDFHPQLRYPGRIIAECPFCHDAVDSLRCNIHDRRHVHVDPHPG